MRDEKGKQGHQSKPYVSTVREEREKREGILDEKY